MVDHPVPRNGVSAINDVPTRNTSAASFFSRGGGTAQAAAATGAVPPMPRPAVAALAHPLSKAHMICAGLVSGVATAGLFNPWDRALYLSVLHSRSFLTPANFTHPYQGFMQVVVHRTLSGGLYFPIFDMAKPIARDGIERFMASQDRESSAAEQSALLHFACGNFAGGVSGVLLNSLTAIKYASWDSRTGFFTTARAMYAAGGYAPFVKGVSATVMRDTVFGGVFALTKFQLVQALHPWVREDAQHSSSSASSSSSVASSPSSPSSAVPAHRQINANTMDFSAALLAGLLATIISAPLNYVRNIKYGWPSDSQPPSAPRILADLWTEARSSSRIASHLQERLRLGWGTARVAVGMAVGQWIYTESRDWLDQHPKPSRWPN